MSSSPTTPGLARFNAAGDGAARAALQAICAGRAWADAVLGGRPYPTAEALYAASDAATAALTAGGLAEAMAAHPPIGRPEPGDPASAREQRGMAQAAPGLRAEMRALNLAYQDKFGHVFLICATGLDAAHMLDAIRYRIDNTPEREREIVRQELGKINRIRLARLLEDPAGPYAREQEGARP
ncbi:2-oxo-4-hydroxy-4-carboxy-5-ureidoimidazoline decarboxylase [Streptomyces rectiverticillatus]|uniref:2-oxo-4-hydroxy-4-carboxy-5-ureidoimidazoline decarboxylase n=1 Tax=Streptomyces rectiverticillatus TaxID=173860 RepID=UPI0015C3BE95|nr:2-oxo-4-hydroxy-4-carboxy-5-ureidoimidazoline decarboxylase [Streptomyces rectiverticillatus]QLE74569.1 2-oxo-4-hydroxy-4-carboxy-5-ureidoimidazoline decarboxylase [Streptomyces rectiverticillatus]